jgi:hypothetical protein
MAPKENLVPHVITDVNGRVTTVYRKPGQVVPAKSLPAPKVKKTYASLAFARLTALELMGGDSMDLLSEADQAVMRKHLAAELNSYPLELIKSVHEAVTRSDRALTMDYLRESMRELIMKHPSHAEVREALMFYPILSKWNEEIIKNLIAALREYEQLPASPDYSLESDAVKLKALSLVTVTSTAFGFPGDAFKTVGKSSLVLKDAALVELALEFPEKADQMVEVMRERRSLDPVLIRSVVANDAAALAEGSL